MNGPSDLFILKQIAVFNQKNDDWIVSIESNKKDELLFGTSKGKIIRFRINNGELAYCDSLFLSASPITQLAILPDINLVILVHNRQLYSLVSNPLALIGPVNHVQAEFISVNRRLKDKSIILFAQATKKQILMCTGRLTDEGLAVEIIEKIATNSSVTNICLDGKALCYSTKTRYYVLDLTVQPRVHHDLISLNESGNSHIVSVGQDEFAICGPDGLIVFIRVDGTSFRAPIDLNTNVVNMLFVRPILYVIGSNRLSAHNVFDENLNISIPIDNLQFMASTVNRVVFLSNDKRVLELELKECYEKEIEQTLKKNIDDGLKLIKCVQAMFPNDDLLLKRCNEIILNESICRFDCSEPSLGFDLFLMTHSDPTSVLSHIKRLNVDDENLWDIELDMVYNFLDKMLRSGMFSQYQKIIQSYLIRVKILTDEIDLSDIDESSLSEYNLKEWLVFNDYHILLAELYFEYGNIADALNIWKEYIDKTGFDDEKMRLLENRLLSIANDSKEHTKLALEMLRWLVPKDAQLSMNIVEQIKVVDLDWISDTFEDYPNLLLKYLESKVEKLGQKDQHLNLCMVKAYVNVLESKNESKIRNSFRDFLANIPFDEQCLKCIPDSTDFEVERLLYSTTVETAEKSIKLLVDNNLEVAEMLYIKFCPQKPELIQFLIPKYVKEDKSTQMQERFLRLLCQIQPFSGIENIIADLPDSYMTRDMITLFQNAIKEYRQHRSYLDLRLSIDKLIRDNEIENQLKKQSNSVRYDSTDKCDLCQEQLKNENISFVQNKVVHSRCLRKI